MQIREPKTDAVVITYNSAAYVEACVESLARGGARVTIVDNGSSDGTLEIVKRKFPAVTLLANRKNLGYAAAVNLGASRTSSEIFAICNADIEYRSDAFQRLAAFVAGNPHIGVAGPQLVFGDGSWQRSYDDLPGIREAIKNVLGLTRLRTWLRRLVWPTKLDRFPRNVGYLPGAAMTIRRRAFEAVGGWDEAFYFYAEDADFCDRMHKAGWSVVNVPAAQVMHVGGASSTRTDASDRFIRQAADSVLLFLQKNASPWQIALYKRLAALNSMQLLWGCRIMSRIGPRKARIHAAERMPMIKHLTRVWREQCHSGSSKTDRAIGPRQK